MPLPKVETHEVDGLFGRIKAARQRPRAGTVRGVIRKIISAAALTALVFGPASAGADVSTFSKLTAL